jgi:deoxyribonuclease IV
MKFNKLRFGTAGIPTSTEQDQGKRNTALGIKQVRNLNLDAMELEFVHSVNIKEDKAPLVNDARKDNDVVLTTHGSYYINLNSLEKPKIEASIGRILQAAKIANMCGVFSLVFHAAYYMKMPEKKVYDNVKKRLKEIVKQLKKDDNPIWIRPETTGKGTQFGTVDEILRLSTEVNQVMPCIDFSHLHARTNGKYNTTEEFREVLTKVEKSLGSHGLENMHIHLSGIAYGEKGERNHLILEESDMNYRDLIKVWKEFKIKGVVICESPNIEEDALLLQKTYEKTKIN